jgi:hypothetical protein
MGVSRAHGPPKPWEVVDPQQTLTEVLGRVSAQPDDVLVAMLRATADGASELRDVRRIHTGPNPDRHDASEMLRRDAHSLAGDDLGPVPDGKSRSSSS